MIVKTSIPMTMAPSPDGPHNDRRLPWARSNLSRCWANGARTMLFCPPPINGIFKEKIPSTLQRPFYCDIQPQNPKHRHPPPWLTMFQTGGTNKRANDSPNRQQTKQNGRTHHATVMDTEMEKPLAPTDQVSTENNDAHFDITPVLSKFEASEEEMKKANEPFATLLGVGNAIPALFNITESASKVMVFKAKTLVPNQVDTCKRWVIE
jgi:hypothetical protein